MVLYPMLIHELQPKTIIELGAFNGGSAVWLADHLELFGIEGRIYSVDIELSFLDEKANSDERVNFLEAVVTEHVLIVGIDSVFILVFNKKIFQMITFLRFHYISVVFVPPARFPVVPTELVGVFNNNVISNV